MCETLAITYVARCGYYDTWTGVPWKSYWRSRYTIVYYYLLLSLLLSLSSLLYIYIRCAKRRTRNNVWESLYFSNDIFANILCELTFRICVNDLYSIQDHVRARCDYFSNEGWGEGWAWDSRVQKNVFSS